MKIEPSELDGKTIYRVFCGNDDLGTVETYNNDFHTQNCYLRFRLRSYDREFAGILIPALGQYINRPLQVMLSSEEEEMADFLKAGGFRRVRRCFEMEVSKEDLIAAPLVDVPLSKCRKGEGIYSACCELLYGLYAETHRKVNPLTADFEAFCQCIPETVFCQEIHGQAVHFAFVEENEIAYMGSTEKEHFLPFIQSVAAELLSRFETISFECDDLDKTAMALKSLFRVEEDDFFDTYFYEKT